MIGIGVILALLGWPFVKLLLIGEAQRIRVLDAVLVGSSALAGIAVLTASWLDLYAYTVLETTLDDQLAIFANDVEARANDEIRAAIGQLVTLERVVDRPDFPGPRFPETRSMTDLAGIDPRRGEAGRNVLLTDADLSSYPEFESFALIDENGEERQKM